MTTRQRNDEMRALYKHGWNVYELMALFNLAESTIRRIVRSGKDITPGLSNAND